MRDDDSMGVGGGVVVFAGAGLGHYAPLAGLLRAVGVLPQRIIIVAQTELGGPMATRIQEDGYSFVKIDGTMELSLTIRRLDRVMKAGVEWTTSQLAARVPAPEMPPLSARLTSAVRTYTKARPVLSQGRHDTMGKILDALRPSLVMADTAVSAPLGTLCGTRDTPWLEYEICPVNIVARARPTFPAGISPSMNGRELLANKLLYWMAQSQDRRARRQMSRQGHRSVAPVRRIAFTARLIDDYPAVPQFSFEYVGIPDRTPVGPIKSWAIRDLIFVSLGSAATPTALATLEFLIPLLGKLEPRWRSVVQLPSEASRRPLETLIRSHHSRVELLERSRRPPLEHFARARLVISHGGYGTVLESLAAGAPVLLFAEVAADRMEVARRVLEAGVGRIVNARRFRESDVLSAIESLLNDPECARRVSEVGADLRLTTARSTAGLSSILAR